jgi:hypothetical protein
MAKLTQVAAHVSIQIQNGDSFKRIITLPFVTDINSYIFSAGIVEGTTTRSMTVTVYSEINKQVQIYASAAMIAATGKRATWFFRWETGDESRTGIEGEFIVR